MNVITAKELSELIAIEGELCISVYMPTYPTGREGQQDAVRLKNLLADAEKQLLERGVDGSTIESLLQPIADLPRQSDWKHRKEGLAIFRSQNRTTYLHSPTAFEEQLVVAEQFCIRPLLPVISERVEFLVLAISRNQVRLLKCGSDSYERLELPGLPENMTKALNLQVADRGEQVHSGMRGDLGKEAGVFHGQGGHRDTLKCEFAEFVRLVGDSLRRMLKGKSLPIVLAGVDYEVGVARKHLDFPVIEASLYGTFDHVTDGSLFQLALPLASKFLAKRRQRALERFKTELNRNVVTDDIEEIVPAAYEGKVDTLFINEDASVFGRYDFEKNAVEFVDAEEPATDLIEQVAVQTVRQRGTVYVAADNELPNHVPICAILRY